MIISLVNCPKRKSGGSIGGGGVSKGKLKSIRLRRRSNVAPHKALLTTYFKMQPIDRPAFLNSRFDLGVVSSKGFDIFWATEDQLPAPAPHNPKWKMSKFSLGDDESMTGFLVAVSAVLAAKPQAYRFKITQALVEEAINATLEELRDIIFKATKP